MSHKDPRLPSEIVFATLTGAEVILCTQSLFGGHYLIFVSIVFSTIISVWGVARPNKTGFQLGAVAHALTTLVVIATLIYSAWNAKTSLGTDGKCLVALALLVSPLQGAAAFACSQQSDSHGFSHWTRTTVLKRAAQGCQTECGPTKQERYIVPMPSSQSDCVDQVVIPLPDSLMDSPKSPKSRNSEIFLSPGTREGNPGGAYDHSRYLNGSRLRQSALTSPGWRESAQVASPFFDSDMVNHICGNEGDQDVSAVQFECDGELPLRMPNQFAAEASSYAPPGNIKRESTACKQKLIRAQSDAGVMRERGDDAADEKNHNFFDLTTTR